MIRLTKAQRYAQAFCESLGSRLAITTGHRGARAVVDALQAFATVTRALPGTNTIDWFRELSDQAERAGQWAADNPTGQSE